MMASREPVEMRFDLPGGLILAGQRFGYPPLRDDERDLDNAGRRVNLILGHGQLDNSNTWKRFMPYFLDTLESSPIKLRATVLVLDYLGHGLSDHRPEPSPDYGRYRWSEDTVRVMNALGWQQASLMAHSAGGEASSIVAVAFPDRIKHLILLDADGLAPRPARAIPLETASFLRKKLRPASEKPFYETPEAAAQKRAKGNAIDGAIGIEAARMLCERSLMETEKDGKKGYTWRTAADLMGNRPGNPTPEICLEFVKRIRCPTLLLAPDKGRVLQRNPPNSPHIQAFTKAVGGNLTYTIVKGGHHAHLESEAGAKECAEAAGNWIIKSLDIPISKREPQQGQQQQHHQSGALKSKI